MKKLARPTSMLLNSFYKHLLAAVLIFIPLYPKFPLFTVPFTYVAIRAEDFLIALVWCVFLLRLVVQKKIKFPPISFQFGVFFFVSLISSISAILITKNVEPLLVLLHLARRLEYMSVFFLIYWAGRESGTRRYFLELSLLPAIGVFLYGIAQIYFEAPVISTMNAESSKGIAMFLRPGVTLNSTFAGHYDLAVYLTMILTFLIAISASINSWFKRLPFLALFVVFLWLFMQAGSRISLVSLVLSVCVVCYLYRRYLLGFVFICLIFAFIATSPQYISRFKSIFQFVSSRSSQLLIKPVHASQITNNPAPTTPQDISTSIRLNVEWPRAIRAF